MAALLRARIPIQSVNKRNCIESETRIELRNSALSIRRSIRSRPRRFLTQAASLPEVAKGVVKTRVYSYGAQVILFLVITSRLISPNGLPTVGARVSMNVRPFHPA